MVIACFLIALGPLPLSFPTSIYHAKKEDDDNPWWVKGIKGRRRREDHELGREISEFARLLSTERDDELTIELSDSAAAAEDTTKAVLDCAVELTLNPQHHVLDTLPVMRTMARLEAERKRGGGVAKKSRSGRFTHYFDSQLDFAIPEEHLSAMCEVFM